MNMIQSYLEGIYAQIIILLDSLVLFTDTLVETVPNELVVLLLLVLVASTCTLSARCKQLNHVVNTLETINKSFERKTDKLMSELSDAIDKLDS